MKRLLVVMVLLITLSVIAGTRILVIGVGDYEDEYITPLPFSLRYARFFSDSVEELIGASSVKLVENPSSSRLIVELRDWVDGAAPSDTLILYYTGHTASLGEDTYLLPSDADSRYIDSTGYNLIRRMDTLFEGIDAKKVIILDIGYSERLFADEKSPVATRISEEAVDSFSREKGIVTFIASRSYETAKERDYNSSLFTYYFLKSFEEIPATIDGEITTNQVYQYIRDEIVRLTSGGQTPVLFGHREVALAKNPAIEFLSLMEEIKSFAVAGIIDKETETLYLKVLGQDASQDREREGDIRTYLIDYLKDSDLKALETKAKEIIEATKRQPLKGNSTLEIVAGNDLGRKGSVYLNGTKIGELKSGTLIVSELGPGSYLLVIDDPEISRWERVVSFENDYEIITTRFVGEPPSRNVNVLSKPLAAKIYLNGQDTGKLTPAVFVLEVGRQYEIEVYLDRYGRKTEKANIDTKGEPIILDIQIPQNPPPLKPTAVTPENGATGIPWGNVVLKWKSGNEELTYSLQYGESSTTLREVANTRNTQYTISAPERGKTYYWKVTATNAFQQETTSDLLSFTTKENAPPTAPKLTAPTNNETIKAEGIALRWDRSTDADGDTVQYQVYFGEGKLTLVSTQSGNQYTPTGIERGKEYTWKVVATDSLGAKSESPVYTFKTRPNTPPTVPKLTFPTDKSQIGVEQVKLSWDRSTDADGDTVQYQVYFGEGKLTLVSTQSGNQYTPTGIERGKEYTWKVVATDSLGAKSESPVYTFKTKPNSPPSAPRLTVPEKNATLATERVTLQWERSTDPDGDEIQYEVSFGEGQLKYVRTQKENQYTPTGIRRGGEYTWQITAVDSYGGRTASPEYSFNVLSNKPPTIPVGITPFTGSSNGESYEQIKFSWICSDPDGDELEYELYYGIKGETKQKIVTKHKEYLVIGLIPNSTYEWKVIAKDVHGEVSESRTYTFHTLDNKPPEVPQAVSPKSGAKKQKTDSVTLKWKSSDPDGDRLLYIVYFGTDKDKLTVKATTDVQEMVISDLEYKTKYYWRVVVTDWYGTPVESQIFDFTTRNNPATTLLWIGGGTLAVLGALILVGLVVDILF